MWPWEHLAAGYLLYSLSLRTLGRDPPRAGAVVAVALATQLPDLVDKPLSWGLGWFPSGFAVGHSAFVAIPVGVAVLVVGRWKHRCRWSVAFVVGYWSHLLADVANPLRDGDPIRPGRVLWPVSEASPYEANEGLGRGLVYLDAFLTEVSTMAPTDLIVLYLLLPVATVILWVIDGAPGMGLVWRTLAGDRRNRQ